MKRAFIQMTLRELGDRLGLRDGLDLAAVENIWELNGVVRLHLRGDLPAYAECEDGEHARMITREEAFAPDKTDFEKRHLDLMSRGE